MLFSEQILGCIRRLAFHLRCKKLLYAIPITLSNRTLILRLTSGQICVRLGTEAIDLTHVSSNAV